MGGGLYRVMGCISVVFVFCVWLASVIFDR